MRVIREDHIGVAGYDSALITIPQTAERQTLNSAFEGI